MVCCFVFSVSLNKERIILHGDEKELLEATAPAANTQPTTFFFGDLTLYFLHHFFFPFTVASFLPLNLCKYSILIIDFDSVSPSTNSRSFT